MPKEHMQAQSLHVPSPDGDGVRTHTRTIEVTWYKDGGAVTLSPGWYQSNYPDDQAVHPDVALLPEAQDSDTAQQRVREGWHAFEEAGRTLGWREVNDLIKQLKRARDDAFGRPE